MSGYQLNLPFRSECCNAQLMSDWMCEQFGKCSACGQCEACGGNTWKAAAAQSEAEWSAR